MSEDYSDRSRWCPHGWAKLQPEGISLCPDCSKQDDDQPAADDDPMWLDQFERDRALLDDGNDPA